VRLGRSLALPVAAAEYVAEIPERTT
jgi:hypothetical protein